MTIRARARRFLPVIIAVGVVIAGFLLVQLGLFSQATTKSPGTKLAAAERDASQTASRGASRTPAPASAGTDAAQVAATQAAAAAETVDTSSTTTSSSTTTTAAPVPAPLPAKPVPAKPADSGANSQTGGASYYSFKPGGCAHKTLPKGTVVTVTNLSSGKTATCVVNDRGPFVAGRIIDLDISVFRQLASTGSGVFSARISW